MSTLGDDLYQDNIYSQYFTQGKIEAEKTSKYPRCHHTRQIFDVKIFGPDGILKKIIKAKKLIKLEKLRFNPDLTKRQALWPSTGERKQANAFIS